MRTSGLLVCFVFATCAGSALAASQADWDDCKQFSNSDRQIAGCTRVLQDQSESTTNRAIAHRNRGIAYDTLGAQDRALADIDAAIKLDPKFAAAHLSRGIVYSKKRENVQAIAAFSEALRLDGKLAVAYSRRADVYYDQKNYDRAIADYNEAIRLDPKVAALYVKRGHANYLKKNYDQAIADYNEAIKIDPNVPEYVKARDNAQKAKRAKTTPAQQANTSGNWVQTPFHLTIDVDSIRKDSDGLVYYRQRHINLITLNAFDCSRRVSYFVQDGEPWRSRGRSVSDGSIGAEAMKFVCSRVR